MKQLVGVLLLILTHVSLAAVPGPHELAPPKGAVPKVYFGMHIHHLWQDTGWPDIPFGTWRLWDSHTTWAVLEPQRNTYDFALLDKYVQAADAHHVELVLTLAATPEWASSRRTEVPMHEGGVSGVPGSAAEPASLGDWQAFVKTVATRYKGRIRYYEIWNEPMSQPFFSGTPEIMVQLVSQAAMALKQVDPNNKILSPPVSGDEKGLTWFDSFLRLGGGQSVDIYGFHFYVGGAPEGGLAKVERARALLSKYGQAAKPMWNTEAGWPVAKLDPQTAADYVARALLLGWPSGLQRYIYYSWDHAQMGIAPSGKSDTPMVRAYATTVHWLQGATVTRCLRSGDGLWIENLALADGSQAKVVWTESGSIVLTKDHIGAATQYQTLDRQTVPIVPGATLQASPSPLLLSSGAI